LAAYTQRGQGEKHVTHLIRAFSAIVLMSIAIFGCKDTDALVQVTTLSVSLPATATVQDGWSLIQVTLVQDGNTQVTTLAEQTTTLTIPIINNTEISVSTVAAQVNASSSIGWHTSTQTFDPMGGVNTLEIASTAAPTKAATFAPELYHAEAQANVAWDRNLAILFVDLNTGFATSPIFKTNQELTMPVGVGWVAVFVDESHFGTEIDVYNSNIVDIVAYHTGIASNPDGLVFFDHHDGLILNSSGGVSLEVQGLVGYDADDHSGIVSLVVGQAPSMPTNSETNATSSTDTVEEGQIVLTEVAGFPETDTAFSIECVAGEACSTATGWQSCGQPFDVDQSTIFMVRYDDIPTLGCLSFEVRMDTDVDLSGSCNDGRSCSEALACDCSSECAAGACGAEGCGSCGVCAALEYCSEDGMGGFSCNMKCTAMDQQVPVTTKGVCINGRQLFVCSQGTVDQLQCLDDNNDDYDCGQTTDGYAICVDSRAECSPNCSELKLGASDGCGNICGQDFDGDNLPCGDGAPLSCDPSLPAISCANGFWQFD